MSKGLFYKHEYLSFTPKLTVIITMLGGNPLTEYKVTERPHLKTECCTVLEEYPYLQTQNLHKQTNTHVKCHSPVSG